MNMRILTVALSLGLIGDYSAHGSGFVEAPVSETGTACTYRFGQAVLPFLNGEHSGYELDLAVLSEDLLGDAPLISAVEGFKDALNRSLRRAPSEDEKSKRLFQKIKNTFYEHRTEQVYEHRIESGLGTWKTTVLAEVPTFFTDGSCVDSGDLYARVLAIYDSNPAITTKKTFFEGEISKFKDTIASIPEVVAAIQEALGPYKVATLKNFLNKQILGLTGGPQLEGAEELFQMLKTKGLIRTSIPTTAGYTYSQQLATREFLIHHPDVHTLILGCGSFAGFAALTLIEGPDAGEGGCGSCSKMHSLKKYEMTVSLMDDPSFSTHYYNEEGSASDVMADAASSAFWAGVLEGIGGKKLRRIEDHSLGQLIGGSNVGYLRSALSDDGEFRVWAQGLVLSAFDEGTMVSTYKELGLEFKGLDGEYMIFGKSAQ